MQGWKRPRISACQHGQAGCYRVHGSFDSVHCCSEPNNFSARIAKKSQPELLSDVRTDRPLKPDGGGTIRLGRRGTRGGTRWCGSGGNYPRPFGRRRNGGGTLVLGRDWRSWLRCAGVTPCASSSPRGG